ncbi:chemerin-like receptor 2 [Aulostomus maculatus]
MSSKDAELAKTGEKTEADLQFSRAEVVTRAEAKGKENKGRGRPIVWGQVQVIEVDWQRRLAEGQKPPASETLHIISVVIYIASFVLGLIGNGIVIWVTGCESKKTVNHVWLLNLAMADFVFVLFLPFYIDYILRDFNWIFGVEMCKINSFVSVMNMFASVLFVTVLSIDRYVSLVHLNWSQRYRTVARAWGICGCIWVLAAALSCPALIFRDTMRLHDKVVCFNNFHPHDGHAAAVRHIIVVVIRTTVGFLLPFTAICVTGILLTVKVNRSQGVVRLSISCSVQINMKTDLFRQGFAGALLYVCLIQLCC